MTDAFTRPLRLVRPEPEPEGPTLEKELSDAFFTLGRLSLRALAHDPVASAQLRDAMVRIERARRRVL